MGRFHRIALIICAASLLAACASSETRSIVSKSDLPTTGYRKIAVFVKDLNPAEPSIEHVAIPGSPIVLPILRNNQSASATEIEQKLISALGNAGIDARAGPSLFKGQKVSEQEKARIVQKDFDATLYVDIVVNGKTEKRVEGAHHNGQYIWWGFGDPDPIDDSIQSTFDLRPDGSVWEGVQTFQTKSELWDMASAKKVWEAETIATGGTLVLARKAVDDVLKKMRADGAI